MENDTFIDTIHPSEPGKGISPRESDLYFVNIVLLCMMSFLLLFGAVLLYFCLKKSVSCPKCMFGQRGRSNAFQRQEDGLPSTADNQRSQRQHQLTGMAAACRHYLNNRASTSHSKEVAIQTEKKGVEGSKQSHPEDDMVSAASMEDIPLDNIYSFSSSHSVNSVVQIHIPSVDQSNPPLPIIQSAMSLVDPDSRPLDNIKPKKRPFPHSAIDLSLIPSWYLKQDNDDIRVPTVTSNLIFYRNNNNDSIEDMNLADKITDTPDNDLRTEEPETEANAYAVSCPENKLAHNKSNSLQSIQHQGKEYPTTFAECLPILQKIGAEGVVECAPYFNAYFTALVSKDLGVPPRNEREEGSKENNLEKDMPSTTLVEDITLDNAEDHIIYENILFQTSDSIDSVHQARTLDVDESQPPITRAQSAMPLTISTSHSPEVYQRPLPASATDLSLIPPFRSVQNDNGSHVATGTSRLIFHRNQNLAIHDNLVVEGAPEGVLGTEKPEDSDRSSIEDSEYPYV
uniref:Uncharacterized protein n=1 Tax=Cuerna arida TaxID=1464854 RepID=A0A1B6GDJ5_9HEMI